jgi:WD40 repeat protein
MSKTVERSGMYPSLEIMVGEKLTNSVLLDESTTRSGDLYIRSICFSPDGKFLATGAEDRQIRVCLFLPSNNPLLSVDNRTRGNERGKRKEKANTRSGISKPVESDPS